jgi:hypothetical protein
MTVEQRDQWECLLADWSGFYDFSLSQEESDDEPFRAAPFADQKQHLKAATPRQLREMVLEDHARRTAAPDRQVTP